MATMPVELPYQFPSADVMEMEPTFGADLYEQLMRIAVEAHPKNLNKSPAGNTEDIIALILKGAVLLKEKFPDESLARCLETSSIWFYG